ncbi:MAG TPA: hypothetical protein DC049_00095 [Spirochaetia bacterium]|nr:hypothetical protein [Spirochaetia bacterium]
MDLTAVSSSAGEFSFSVTNGTYYINVNSGSYSPLYGAKKIIITGSDSLDHEIYLAGLFTVSGTVYDNININESKRAMGVWVILEGDVTASNQTSSSGTFSFIAKGGVYSLYGISNNYSVLPEKELLHLTGPVTNLSLTLINKFYFISGCIKDSRGTTYKSIPLCLDSGSNPVFTDTAGFYTVAACNGPHVLSIADASYVFINSSTNIIVSGNHITNINFEIAAGGEGGMINFLSSRMIKITDNQAVPFAVYKKESGNHDSEIALYDLKGKIIKKIYSGILTAGVHNYSILKTGINAGVYIIQIKVNENGSWKRYHYLITAVK